MMKRGCAAPISKVKHTYVIGFVPFVTAWKKIKRSEAWNPLTQSKLNIQEQGLEFSQSPSPLSHTRRHSVGCVKMTLFCSEPLLFIIYRIAFRKAIRHSVDTNKEKRKKKK